MATFQQHSSRPTGKAPPIQERTVIYHGPLGWPLHKFRRTFLSCHDVDVVHVLRRVMISCTTYSTVHFLIETAFSNDVRSLKHGESRCAKGESLRVQNHPTNSIHPCQAKPTVLHVTVPRYTPLVRENEKLWIRNLRTE